MAGRAVGVVVTLLAVLALTTVALFRLRGPVDSDVMAFVSILALVACGLAARGALRGTTAGPGTTERDSWRPWWRRRRPRKRASAC